MREPWAHFTTPMIKLSWYALKLRFKLKPIGMAGCEPCGARNQCAKNESDVYLDAPITILGETLECVDSFTYIGSVISTDGSAQKGIKNRLSKDRNAFANIRPVWRSSVYSIRAKLNLYNSIVKCVLLYGSECWKVVETDFHKFGGISQWMRCLCRICRIFWPRTISNLELLAKTNSKPI